MRFALKKAECYVGRRLEGGVTVVKMLEMSFLLKIAWI